MKEELVTMEELETNEILSDLYYVKQDITESIILQEIKLEKLGISEAAFNAIKKSFSY